MSPSRNISQLYRTFRQQMRTQKPKICLYGLLVFRYKLVCIYVETIGITLVCQVRILQMIVHMHDQPSRGDRELCPPIHAFLRIDVVHLVSQSCPKFRKASKRDLEIPNFASTEIYAYTYNPKFICGSLCQKISFRF